jgi:hypothetical protein
MRNLLRSSLAVSFGLLVCRASAQLLNYEDFNYTPGNNNIGGQSGGTGFQNAWLAGSGNIWGSVQSGSLSYADQNGHSLDTSGNSLLVGTNGASGTTATPQRVFTNSATAATLGGIAALNAANPGVIWMSFLYQRDGSQTGAPFFRQANFGLFQGSSEKLDVGGPNTSATIQNNLSLWSTGTHPSSAPLQSTTPVFGTSAQFIVLELTVDTTTAADGVSVWFNPPDLSSLGAPNLTSTSEVDISGVNTFRFQAGNSNANGTNAVFEVDEFRIGDTFADVAPYSSTVPEPSIIAFASIGGLAVWAWRRKRSTL